MKISIEINCDTVYQLQQHLSSIKAHVKQKTKILHLTPVEHELPGNCSVSANNCYGGYQLKVIQDGK